MKAIFATIALVDGCHPNDYGMVLLSKAFGVAVRRALANSGE